ncbi:MAG: hypothetical protein ACI4XF_07140 [Oscillospiraceae bacterium]
MAESKRRPRKLKGAVLVMVVTLLFVLVVMLLATLTVVSNANRRTITKYEENQAYYTARSALEVYIDEMLEDYKTADNPKGKGSQLKAEWEGIKKPSGGDTIFTFADDDSKDLGTNLTDGKVLTGKEDISNGFVLQQEIFCNLVPKYCANLDSDGTLVSDSDKAEENWQSTKDVWSGYTEGNSTVEFTAKLPETNNISLAKGNVGTMADNGEVKITVELLRMLYRDKDGKVLYDGVTSMSKIDDVNDVGYNADDFHTDGKIKMSAISWGNTYYRLKVTATTSIKDSTGAVNESTVSVLLEPNPGVTPASFTKAKIATNGSTDGAKGNAIGGGGASNPGKAYKIENDSVVNGSFVYEYSAVQSNSQSDWYMPSKGYFVVRDGYLSLQNGSILRGYGSYNTSDPEERNNRPVVYAAGIGGSNHIYIGQQNEAVDVIVSANGNLLNSYDTEGQWSHDTIKISGIHDGYNIDITDSTGGKNVAFVCGPNDTEVYGDIYCDGDMAIQGSNDSSVKFHGTVYCSGNIYVKQGMDITKLFENNTMYIGGSILNPDGTEYKLNVDGDTSTGDDEGKEDLSDVLQYIPGKNVKVGQDQTAVGFAAGDLGFPYPTKPEDELTEEDYYKKLTLPGRSEPVTINSVKMETKNFWDDSGKMKSALKMFADNIKCAESDVSLSVDSSAPIMSKDLNGISDTSAFAKRTDYKYTDKNGATVDGKLFENTYKNSKTGYAQFQLDLSRFWTSDTFFIDARTDNVQVEILSNTSNPTAASPTFIILGNKSVVFTVKDNATVQFGGMKIFTEDIYSMYKNKSVFEFGDEDYFKSIGKSPDSPSAPNIYYYFGSGVTFNPDNLSTMLCGYMYAPDATFKCTNGGSSPITYTYNGGASKTKDVSVIGSMVFKVMETNNNFGVGFVPPMGSDNDSNNGAMITWDKQQWLGR